MSLFSQMVVLANLFSKRTSAPVGDENALIVRNIPSGVQQVQITTQTPGISRSYFNEIASVAIGASETVISHTVPAGRSQQLLLIEMSGTNIATYDILLNGAQYARKRTYFGGDLAAVHDEGNSGIKLTAGDVIEVQVTNFRPYIGAFESRIQLLEI